MSLPIHKRYEIIFLSCHSRGPKLGLKAVAKEVKCDKKAVKYWLNRWKQSKDLTDLPRSGRPRETTQKQDERIVSLANQEVDHERENKRGHDRRQRRGHGVPVRLAHQHRGRGVRLQLP